MSDTAEQLISRCDFGTARLMVSGPPHSQVALLVRERSAMIRYLGNTTVACRAGMFEEQGCVLVVVLLRAGEHVRPVYLVWWNYHAAGGAEVLRLLGDQTLLGVHFHGDNGRRERSFVLENPLRKFCGRALQTLTQTRAWTEEGFQRGRRQFMARFGSPEALWEELGPGGSGSGSIGQGSQGG